MIKVKDKESKISVATRTIIVTGVSIINGEFMDEEGAIASKFASYLPNGINKFDIKIKFELTEEFGEEGNEE